MVRAALRDLQWRKLRFGIAVIGTALVFAISLLLVGVSASFGREAGRVLRATGADVWLVRDGVPGPFTTLAPMSEAWAEQIKGPSVERADPVLVVHHTVRRVGSGGTARRGEPFRDVTVFGVRRGGLGEPRVVRGKAVAGGSDAVVDERLGYRVGQTFGIGGQIFTVTGLTRSSTLFAGLPDVFVDLASAQHLFAGVGDGDVVNAILVRGTLQPPVFVLGPAGAVTLRMLTPAEVRADILRPLANARATIDLVRALLWVIAACIVGSVVYITALERTRDFAVFKATGVSSAGILAGIVVESLVLAVASGLLGAVAALALAPSFPVPVTVPAGAFVLLGVLAVGVGGVASLAGLRRVVRTDPAAAFAGP